MKPPTPTPPPTTWTVTGHPRRITPVTVALIAGAATNLAALAILATILLDGPLWLAITLTVATVALPATAHRAIRAIPKTSPPQYNSTR